MSMPDCSAVAEAQGCTSQGHTSVPAALLLRNMSKAMRPVLSQEAPTLQVVANRRKLGSAAFSCATSSALSASWPSCLQSKWSQRISGWSLCAACGRQARPLASNSGGASQHQCQPTVCFGQGREIACVATSTLC